MRAALEASWLFLLVLMGFPGPLPAPAPAPTASPSLASSHAHRAMCKATEEQNLTGFLQGKPKSGLKEQKVCICITLHLNCRGDAAATLPLPVSGMFITPCRNEHLTFPKAQPKSQPQPALAWGTDTASHRALSSEQPPLVRNGRWHCMSFL